MGTLRQEVKRLAAELKAMTAERDALVGAAYAASAEWCRKNERHGSIPAYNILRLTPADAATALDHIRAEAKADGIREAAAICMDEDVGYSCTDCYQAILAAAQKEVGKCAPPHSVQPLKFARSATSRVATISGIGTP